jgi:hypothetical protein
MIASIEKTNRGCDQFISVALGVKKSKKHSMTNKRISPSWGTVLRIRDVYNGSRILFFTHPGSRISDPGSKKSNKREGLKKLCCQTFFSSHKFDRIENYYIFEKKLSQFAKNYRTFYIKIVTKLSKICGSGSRGQKGTGSRIRIRNPDGALKTHRET